MMGTSSGALVGFTNRNGISQGRNECNVPCGCCCAVCNCGSRCTLLLVLRVFMYWFVKSASHRGNSDDYGLLWPVWGVEHLMYMLYLFLCF
jgi:hypothetical protein